MKEVGRRAEAGRIPALDNERPAWFNSRFG